MKDACYTLENCTILTVDEQDHFYPAGRLVVKGKRIAGLGHAAQVEPQGERLDMGGALVMPGLVNTHTHSHSSLFRGQADDLPLMEWLEKAMWPMEAHLTAKHARAATRLSCLEYLKSGTTTYADQFYFAGQVAEAAQESGLRCFLAATVFEKASPETGDTLGAALAFVKNWLGREAETRVYPCLGPHAPYSVSAEQFRALAAASAEYGLLIHTHISETQAENTRLQEATGQSPTAWLAGLGVLNRPVLAAHSVHLCEEDLALYARHGVAVSYNPVSNMKLASGVLPLAHMRRHGLTVALGTDGAQSNNTMDLLRDLRTGILLQKLHNQNAAFIEARSGVRMATIEGAKALRMESEIGSLELGKRADWIALDTESVRLTPLHRESLGNLYAAVCYAAVGDDVRDVAVDGEILLRQRKVLRVKEADVRAEGQAAAADLVQKAGL